MLRRGTFFILLQIIFGGNIIYTAAVASSTYSCHVENHQQQNLSPGYVIQTSLQPNDRECVAECMTSSNCRSAAFCHTTGTCTLSNFTSVTDSAPVDLLTSDGNCTYLDLSNCQTPGYDPCSQITCQNSGKCVIVDPTVPRPVGECSCPFPFIGKFCQSLDCPAGFDVEYGTSCYMIDTSLQKNYADAVTYCMSLGAHLVAVSDANEHAFLHNQISSDNSRSGLNWWVDANDETNEGTFVMRSWGNIPLPYTAWDNGQPDDGGNQDCGYYWNSGAAWDDGSCSSSINFICEYVGY